jgi:hypothetical protein
MRVDSYIEDLLRKWGSLPESVYVGIYKRCPYLKEYRPRGYKDSPIDLDRSEVERLADFLSANLSPMRIMVLRVRYRHKVRYKRKAARLLGLSEARYNDYFKDCINAIESRFLERIDDY